MFRTVSSFMLAFGFVLITALLQVSSGIGAAGSQEVGKTAAPLTEADLIALIGNQSDDRAIVKRLEMSTLAFTLDAAALKRIQQAHPSKEVLAALTRFQGTQTRVQPVVGTWEVLDSGVKEKLYSVAFINDQVGVAVGANYTILRTTDGGKTWKRVMGPKKDEHQRFASVLFADDKVGWVKNSGNSETYRTDDGGATWHEVKMPGKPGTVYSRGSGFSTHAAAGNTYFHMNYKSAFGGNFLSVTQDGGKTWKDVWETDDGIQCSGGSLAFPDAKEGWVSYILGIPHNFYVGRTSDGGKTWTKLQIKEHVAGNYSIIRAVDKDHGWFVSHFSRYIHASTDGGKTWTPYALGNGSDGTMVSMQFLDTKTGFVLCGDKYHVRQTSDGGKTWTSLGVIKVPQYLHGMVFTSATNGYVVGDNGYIARYTVK